MKRFLSIAWFAAACLAEGPQAPSLLSRGLLPNLQSFPSDSFVRPSLGAMSGYDSGLLSEKGPFQEIDGGLEALHAGRRSTLRLDYRFGLRPDRSAHGLNLDTSLRLSRRFTLQLRDVASSSRFGEAPPLPGATAFLPDPGPEVLHSRTVTNTALADLVFAASARTSIALGGDGFVVEREHRGLADVLGWRARADLAHRYSRYRTVTFSYAFTHFDHSRSFGGADYAVYAVGHSARLGKHTELDLLAGAGQLRSAGTRPVELDPEIARILGTARGAEIFRLHTWNPHWIAGWSQLFGRTALRFELARLVSDGGGLSGLARQNQATLSLSGPLSPSWRLTAHLAGRTYRSLDTLLYDSTTAGSGFTLSRRLGPRTEAVARYQYNFYHFDQGLLRATHRHQVAAGVVYHFNEAPSR